MIGVDFRRFYPIAQSFRRGVTIAESWFFHLWYLTEYKWEKYNFQTVCSLDLDEGLCKIKIGKNDAIAMLLAVKKTFFQSNPELKKYKMKPVLWESLHAQRKGQLMNRCICLWGIVCEQKEPYISTIIALSYFIGMRERGKKDEFKGWDRVKRMAKRKREGFMQVKHTKSQARIDWESQRGQKREWIPGPSPFIPSD